MILSIIIPVYNTEEYIAKCVVSILNQPLYHKGSVEIILVNDGSTDKSLEICTVLSTKSNKIIVLNQQNQGQSVARNAALKIAQGEYIWFVDSDDWITDDSLNEINKIISKNKLDVLVLSAAENINGENVLINNLKLASENKYTNIEYLKSSFLEVAPWVYILNRNFLSKHNFYFHEGIVHEDNEFTYRLIYETKTIDYLDKICYVVNLREGSTTRSINPKRSFDLLTVCNRLNEYMSASVKKEDYSFFINIISMLFNNALYNIHTLDRDNKVKFERAINENLFLVSNLKKSSILKYKIEGFLMSLPRINRIKVYKFMKSFSF